MSAKVVDCQRHIVLTSLQSVLDHLEPAWAARVAQSEFILPPAGPHPGTQIEPSAVGGGSDPHELSAALGDDHGEVVLVPSQATVTSGWLSPPSAAAFVAAVNDLVVADWIGVDERFRFAVVVAPHDGVLAAAEIRRMGAHPAAAAVVMPLMAVNMGQPHYHPIYAAAEALGLPLMVHPGGGEGNVVGPPVLGGVGPRTPEETYSLLPQVAMTNLASLIFDGVFERFPKLKVVFAGFGCAWIPPILWRADVEWRGLRVDVPWVRHAPSQYAADHVRFAVDGSSELRPETAAPIVGMLPPELLLYGSDAPFAPHDARETLASLPDELLERITSTNARETLRLDRIPSESSV